MRKVLQNNILFTLACAFFALATVAFLTHDLSRNQQYDTQVIRYGFEWIEAAEHHAAWDWITQVPARKYPMMYVIPFTATYKAGEMIVGSGNLTFAQIHFLSRFITLLYALGTMYFLVQTARLLKLNVTHVLLLLFSSMLFFLFETAVRPHGAVACWTIAAYYFAVQYHEKKMLRSMALSYVMAALAFATLQSGLFAFIFPVWISIFQKNSGKNRGISIVLCAVCLGIAAIVGYPFLLRGIMHTEGGAIDTSLGHDIAFQFLPQIMLGKFWSLLISETLLLVFGITGIIRLTRKRPHQYSLLIPVFCYLALFYSVFLMQEITSTRFFLPTLPFLALLGTFAFPLLPKKTAMALSLLVIAIYAECAWLGFKPGTMEEASAFLDQKPGVIASNLPPYFFLLPPERFVTEKTKDSIAYAILSTNDVPTDMQLCGTFLSSPDAAYFAENNSPFLWNAVEWPLFFVFQVRALGPNLRVYCSPNSFF